MPGDASRANGRKGGRPKGPQTIEKAILREQVRAHIAPHIPALIQAQLTNAKGLKYLVVRDKKTGKFIRVTESMAKAKQERLDPEHELIEVWEKDPSVQAFMDLMNRAIDKPAEQMKVTGEDGGPVEHVFRWQQPPSK